MIFQPHDLKSSWMEKLILCLLSAGVWYRAQAQQRAAEKWKDKNENTRELLLCGLSAKLKDEVCASATHTMDEVDLAGFSMFEGLRGLDCNLPGFAFQHISNIFLHDKC